MLEIGKKLIWILFDILVMIDRSILQFRESAIKTQYLFTFRISSIRTPK